MDKLKSVREASLHFNVNTFGDIRARKRKILRRIAGIQRVLSRVDSARLTILEHELRVEYDATLRQEEVLWFQNSPDAWIKLGDNNTKYFHLQALIRRHKNKIIGLNIDDQWETNATVLRDPAFQFFSSKFSLPRPMVTPRDIGQSTAVDGTQTAPLCSLSHLPPIESRHNLTTKVSLDEVTKAVHEMKAFAAPGPDGFQIAFFKCLGMLLEARRGSLFVRPVLTRSLMPRSQRHLFVLYPKLTSHLP